MIDALDAFIRTRDPASVERERMPPLHRVAGESFGAPGHAAVIAHAEYEHGVWQITRTWREARRRQGEPRPLDKARASAAERMRRHRARQRGGLTEDQQLAIAMRALSNREKESA